MSTAASPHRKRRVLPVLVVAVAAASWLALTATAPAAVTSGCTGASATPAEASPDALAQATVCLLDQERSRYGLRPLRLNARLAQAALAHSRDMVEQRYFSHTTPSGATFGDRIRAAGYLDGARAWMLGENIGWGTLQLSTPEEAVSAWMHSPGHRANILCSSFRDIGAGVAVGVPDDLSGPAATYTTDFGVKVITQPSNRPGRAAGRPRRHRTPRRRRLP